MKKLFYILLTSTLLVSCGTKELTKEESCHIEKVEECHIEKVEVTTNTVVKE